MGRKTYEALLGLVDVWPYPNCTTYVVTRDTSFEITTGSTSVLHEISEEVINDLRSRSGKNIWLVGGGELISRFVNLGAIDEMIISIIPLILGKGLRLFTGIPVETNYEPVNTESFETGVVNLKYKKKQKKE
jgi:dihydrofolate reductase